MYAFNNYDTNRKAKAAYAKKMARRRLITAVLAGILFVVGVNWALAIRDAAMRPTLENKVKQMVEDLDASTDQTNYIIQSVR